ncbi:MAG: DUF423 domain-containing protein [Anaerolineae bacterium]
MDRTFAVIGGIAAALAVALGAFGAHGLRGRLGPDLLAIFETGVRYQMYHALGLWIASLLATRHPQSSWLAAAGWLFVAGIVFFSGSLYALALAGLRQLGAVAPIGGLAFIAGWLALAVAAWRG